MPTRLVVHSITGLHTGALRFASRQNRARQPARQAAVPLPLPWEAGWSPVLADLRMITRRVSPGLCGPLASRRARQPASKQARQADIALPREADESLGHARQRTFVVESIPTVLKHRVWPRGSRAATLPGPGQTRLCLPCTILTTSLCIDIKPSVGQPMLRSGYARTRLGEVEATAGRRRTGSSVVRPEKAFRAATMSQQRANRDRRSL